MNRRGILKLLGMAPVAAPQATAEVAASMGLSSGIGAGTGLAIGGMGMSPVPSEDHSWLRRMAAELTTGARRKEAVAQSRQMPLMLDPDIAALRSASPAWKRMRQGDRWVERQLESDRSYIERAMRNAGLSF